jgi:hypothetical protein
LAYRSNVGKVLPAPPPCTLNSSTIDFCQAFCEQSFYDPFHGMPQIIPHEAAVQHAADGATFLRSELAAFPSVLFAFPAMPKDVQAIRLRGRVANKSCLTFRSYTPDGNEIVISQLGVEKEFTLVLPFPHPLAHLPVLLRIAWEGTRELSLGSLGLLMTPVAVSQYAAYPAQDIGEFSHFELTTQGIRFRGMLPHQAPLFVSGDIRSWLDRHLSRHTEEDETPNGVDPWFQRSPSDSALPIDFQRIEAQEAFLYSLRLDGPLPLWRRMVSLVAPRIKQNPILHRVITKLGILDWYRKINKAG